MNAFTEDYFMRGAETGLSNYTNYTWRPDLTIPACRKMMEYLGAKVGDSVIDIGCSRGFYVKAMRAIGFKAWGQDVSDWAIQNCDPEVRDVVSTSMPSKAFDWATLKDVSEHILEPDLKSLLASLNCKITKGMLFIVPLSGQTGGKYIREEDERDVTHVLRWTFNDWIDFLEANAPEFNVNASYHIHGIKPASQQVRHSCGFFTLLRP